MPLPNKSFSIKWLARVSPSQSLPLCVACEDFTCTKKFGDRSLERFYHVVTRETTDAIAATKRLPGRLANVTVGHLLREISRFTRFLLLRGGVVNVEVIMTQSTEDLLLDRVALKFQ